MKKKLTSLAICLAMILSFANFSITVSADSYFSGSGTAQDPYLIQTAADLTQLATLTNTAATGTTYAVGKYYKLTADIDMSGVGAYMPISRAIGVGGTHTLPGGTTFKSTFDGDGHIIKNVTMTAQTLAAGGSTYGIIGWLGLDGVVKNLGVENITADGGSTATTLCIGGIVGTIGGGAAQPCAIQNCYVRGMTVTATANGNQFVGGIVGRTVGQKGSIDNCYATELSYTLANTNYAAGILGACGNSAHTASNCYTTYSKTQGWATATSQYMVETNCYASGAIANATPANLGASFKADPNYKNGGYPLLSWETETVFAGSGTEQDPYLISTPADLKKLATLTNTAASGTTYAVGKYYKLTADIDMSGVGAYMPISRAIGVGGTHTLPGGTTFKSTFDGDGHIIKNVTMTAQTLAAGGSTYGIIGWLGLDGVVKNLGVENITADGGSTATALCIGGIVGTIGGGTAQPCAIQNCYVRGMTVTATASGNQFVGGIVGRTVGQKGSIDNCYATELSYALANTSFAAGILGACGNSAHTASNCYTTYSKIQGNATATNSYMVTTNCYASDAIANATAANLGAAFKKNTGISNSGYTLLAWEEIVNYDGAGTQESPYLIHNANELMALSNLSNSADSEMNVFASKHYRLTSDIDLTGISYKPISYGISMYTPQGARFTGTIDGNGHIIRNINIPAAHLGAYGATAGIIGILGAEGTVKNLGVENMTVTTGSATYMCIGGIAGSLMAGMSIDKCYVRGMTVNAESAGSPVYVGGIVGRTIGNAGTITNCYSTGLSFAATNDTSHSAGIMGACGNSGYSATNCYTTYSKVQGNSAATESYMAETNCYSDGATSAQMGLNYVSVNSINDGNPILIWEYENTYPSAEKVTVTVNKTGNGDIEFVPAEISGTSISVYPGQGLGFTLTPSENYVITKVNYDGNSLTTDDGGRYLFDVNGNGTLNVTFVVPTANDITLYVSNSGSDANAGTSEAPLKTISAAILATRAVTGDKTINIANGEYSAEKTITLSDIDDNIAFKAYQGGKVVFNGGKNIDKSLFNEYSENENILVADLSDAGITNFGSIKALGYGNYANIADAGYNPVIAIDGEYQIPARYPNSGYLSANSIVTGATNSENLSFTTSDVDATRWEDETNLGVAGFFGNVWADLSVPATVSGEGTISLSSPSYYGANKNYVRFYVFNALSELDTQGEYYLDTAQGKLYIYKPANWASVGEISFAAGDNNIVAVTDAVNVTFEGITFENTNANGIKAQRATGLSVINSEFQNIGRDAMYINASNNAEIKNNIIRNIGVTGVRYVNGGDRTSLTSCGTVISNNDISYIGNIRKSGSYAVDIENVVGVKISENELHNLPHGAILYNTCNDTVIEYNRIYNTNNDAYDSGAIYSGRDWTTRGNEIRYNYFHDIAPSLDSDVQAIYLDDAHSSTYVHHNVFYRVPNVILIGGGRDNIMRNNLIIDSNYFFRADERVTRWDENQYKVLTDRYDAIPYTSSAWSKYAHISNILEDQPTRAKYNNIEYNVRYNTNNTFSHPSDAFLTNGSNNVNNNSVLNNTSFFLNYADGEFALSSSANSINASAYSYVKDIPFEKMGFAVNAVKVNAFDLTDNGANLTASISVNNYTGSVQYLQLLIAQYDSDSKLISAARKAINNIAAGAEATDSLTAAKDANATEFKAFLWTKDFEPLCENK